MSRPSIEAIPDRLTALVSEQWQGWTGEDAPPLEWVLSSTARPNAQTSVILYAIDPATREPALVAKVCRDPEQGFVVEREAKRVNEARAAIGLERQKTIPRPFGLIRTERDVYLVSEFAPATQRWDRLRRAERAIHTDRLTSWLAALHDGSERPIEGSHRPEPIVDTYLEVFETTRTLRDRLHEAQEWIVGEFAAASTEILVHGDFWPGNWRIDRDRFMVIDWEHAHWSPSPVLDEFLYPLSLATEAEGGEVPNLASFSDAYRARRGLPARGDEEIRLASIWTAAEVATRTHRRWGVTEDWSHRWHRALTRLVR